MQDIRWKQRFQNFEKAYEVFEKILKIKNPNEAEKMGLIQAFEINFELSWKLLKDYLEQGGYIIKSPRQTLKQAFQDEIIKDGHVWMKALDDRNLTTHIYDNEKSLKIEQYIRNKFAPALKDFYITFKEKNNE